MIAGPIGLALLVLPLQVGCEPPPVVRVYDAPKSDTEFVSGPLAGTSNAPMSLGGASAGVSAGATSQAGGVQPAGQSATGGPRRILGAVLPLDSGCYFLKATDSPERLEPLMEGFLSIVQGFAIDEQTGRPSNALPSGWKMNPRNDIALAEFVSPESTGGVKFTVTALAMPGEKDWPEYLLSNVNRWRGQLKIDPVSLETLNDSLIAVPRGDGKLPSYIFDAAGTGSGGMAPGAPNVPGAPNATGVPSVPRSAVPSPVSSSNNPSTGPSTGPASTEKTTATPAPVGDATSGQEEVKRPDLKYRLPEGWSVGQGSAFRLATLKIESAEGNGEVTVSMATDNPQANTAMWAQQVLKGSDPSQVDPVVQKSLESVETLEVGAGQAKLYTVRSSPQPDAPMLIVASIPTENPELHLFVKLIGDNRLGESQKQKLIEFVQSITLK